MTQLALFEAAPPLPHHDQMRQIALSAEVELDMMAIFFARPDEWLGYCDFQCVQKKYGFDGIIGHLLARLCRVGKLDEKNIFFADGFGGKNYQGFKCAYMLAKGPAA